MHIYYQIHLHGGSCPRHSKAGDVGQLLRKLRASEAPLRRLVLSQTRGGRGGRVELEMVDDGWRVPPKV